MLHLFQSGGHLRLRAAVNQCHVRTQSLSRATRVHGGIATTYHYHSLAEVHGRVSVWIGGIHQVHPRKVLVGRHDVEGVLSRDIHEVGETRSRTDEDALEAFLLQLIHADGLTHDDIRLEVDTHLAQVVYFHVHDSVGQAEFRNAVFQNTAYLVQRLKYVYVVTFLHHIARKAQSRGSRAYHRYLDAIGRLRIGQRHLPALSLVIGGETLQVAYSHGRFVHLHVHAPALALLLLRANPAAYGGERRCLLQHLGGRQELSALYVLHERGNVDAHGTTLYTLRIGTVQTTFGLRYGHLLRESLVYLLQSCLGTIFRIQFWHDDTGNGHALLWFHGST